MTWTRGRRHYYYLLLYAYILHQRNCNSGPGQHTGYALIIQYLSLVVFQLGGFALPPVL